MRQTRRPRTPNDTRDRRTTLVAVAMLLLALAAGILVSAGSAHHRPGTAVPASGAVVDDDAAADPLSVHRHRHGNEWVPTMSKRLRPAATVAVVGIIAARPVTSGGHDDGSPSAAPPSTGEVLAVLGVLRV